MQCTQCSATLPYQEETGAVFACLFCTGMQYATATDILSNPSVGFTKERRESQVRLTALLEESIHSNKHAIIEAGTGVGKSYAYMLSHILSKTNRIVVSTAKKSLQGQLIKKDLPYIADTLQKLGFTEHKITYAAAYGRSNYVCYANVAKHQKKKLTVWNDEFFDRTDVTTDGLADDIPYALRKQLHFTPELSAENCRGTSCKYSADCLYIAAKQRMVQSRIVVTNHWLVGYHIKQSMEQDVKTVPGLLGNQFTLIVDEAHKFDEGVRSAFTLSTTQRAMTSLLNAFNAHKLSTNGVNTFCDFDALEAKWNHLFGSIKEEGIVSISETLATAITDDLTEPRILSALRANGEPYAITAMSDEARAVLALSMTIRDTLKKVGEGADGYITYAENDRGTKKLSCAPVSTRPYVAQLLRTTPTKFLSATLAIGGSLEPFREKYGVENAITAQFGSAFDLGKQSVLYLSREVGAHTATNYIAQLSQEIDDLITASKGNAFVLFTSRSELEQVFTALRHKHNIISQTEYYPNTALHKYHSQSNATLFGLKSFWEGVDITGDKLSLVVIAKLPFPNQSDPIFKARCALAQDKWFHKVALPEMIIDLRQGVGRLIRSKTDKGVVAVLDERMHTKPYRKTVLTSLGMPRVTSSKPAVLSALNRLSENYAQHTTD